MKYLPMITSLLENDLYKFNMGQVIWRSFQNYTTTWTFKCRNEDVLFSQDTVQEIRDQIKHYCSLRFTQSELDYLKSLEWLKPAYIDYLKFWYPDFDNININLNAGKLEIEVTGPWLHTTMYEIPILAIVNETYFRMQHDYDKLLESFTDKAQSKIEALNLGNYQIGNFSEFGLRRRLSGEAQDLIVNMLSDKSNHFINSNFVGTSNVYLAKKYGIKPIGTMAHEYIMCVGQGNPMHNPAYSNWYMMDAWIKEYGTWNGIALTDTITTDNFLLDFQQTFATVFSGVRHDSGDPIEWGEKMIKHYLSLGIDPMTKTLLFSDSLNFEKADMLYERFKARTNVAFGIGTYLSNDTCVKPLNIVMKVTKCNGLDVAKLSDTEGKGICKNPEYVEYLKRTINWRNNVS